MRQISRRRKLKRRINMGAADPVVDLFTRKARGIVLRALAARLPKGRAAGLAGVTYPIFRSWMDKGLELQGDMTRPINAVFVSFRRKVIKLEAKHEKDSLRRIELAAEGGREVTETKVRIKSLGDVQEREVTKVIKKLTPVWQADAWYLERTKRGTYGREAVDQSRDKTPEEDAIAIKEAADALFDSVPVGGGE